MNEPRGLGNFESDRKKPRSLMITLLMEHDASLVIAKAVKRRRDLNDKANFVLPVLSKEDSGKEILCLKEQRQRLEQNVPSEELETLNL